MKRLVFSIVLSTFLTFSAFAQWTDNGTSLTTLDKVGIGTNTPSQPLQVEKAGNTFLRLVNTGVNGSTVNFGPVSSNGYVETQLQFERELGFYDHSQTQWRFKIKSNGFVGIGTTTPAAKVDIEGGDVLIGEEVSSNGSRRMLRVYGFDNNAKFFGTMHSNYDDGRRTFDISTNDATQQMKFDVSARADGRITLLPGVNGNVGIGTTTPAAKVDIEGGDVFVGEEAAVNGTRRMLRVYGFDNNAKFFGTMHSNYDDSRRTFDISTNSATQQLKLDVSARTDGRIALLPGSNAGVGIGTLTTGSHKLAVEGSIGAREIRVETTGWSDFVFENDYQLRSLEEVEAHINENGHLPEIPSEPEVLENGINLGEMDAKLLQKIEELTLYLIEQNKQNQAQQARIEQLEKELKAIKGK